MLLLTVMNSNGQNVGIGTTAPHPSAQLDVSSNNKGFLPPRMTIEQRNSIIDPVAGLIIFCIDCDEIQYFNGASWKNLQGKAACTELLPPNISICNQTWMTNNLNVDRYQNGDLIPNITNPTQWASLTTGAWCWYDNDSIRYSKFGKLYNWYAVNDPRGLAPKGWRVPSESDWNKLIKCIDINADTTWVDYNNSNTAAGALKTINTWFTPNTNATNASGFSALPAGLRNLDGSFFNFGLFGSFWSTQMFNPQVYSWLRTIPYNSNSVKRDYFSRNNGFSVRCLKN